MSSAASTTGALDLVPTFPPPRFDLDIVQPKPLAVELERFLEADPTPSPKAWRPNPLWKSVAGGGLGYDVRESDGRTAELQLPVEAVTPSEVTLVVVIKPKGRDEKHLHLKMARAPLPKVSGLDDHFAPGFPEARIGLNLITCRRWRGEGRSECGVDNDYVAGSGLVARVERVAEGHRRVLFRNKLASSPVLAVDPRATDVTGVVAGAGVVRTEKGDLTLIDWALNELEAAW